MAAWANERVAEARAAAAAMLPTVIDLTERIAAIPAPTHHERERGSVVAEYFRRADLAVTVDDLGDVIARQPGVAAGPPLLLAAHLDTVFPFETPVGVRRQDDRLVGPGVGDNSLGVAAILTLPALLDRMGVAPAVDVLLTGNVGEEGLGNLRGMRAVMDAHPEIGAAIAIEGHNLGRVTHIAVGSRRLRVHVTGPGGHSWGDHGRPSAIHAMADLVHELTTLPLPNQPKTALNVGLVEGGISVNTIAPSASFVLDLRSVDPGALEHLGQRVERAIAAANRDGIAVVSELLGERPAGVAPLDSRIVRIAGETLAALGIAAMWDASSTDANVPISRDVPAICLGLTTGGNVHREDEYIDLEPVATGLAQLAVITLRLADELAAGRLRGADGR